MAIRIRYGMRKQAGRNDTVTEVYRPDLSRTLQFVRALYRGDPGRDVHVIRDGDLFALDIRGTAEQVLVKLEGLHESQPEL